MYNNTQASAPPSPPSIIVAWSDNDKHLPGKALRLLCYVYVLYRDSYEKQGENRYESTGIIRPASSRPPTPTGLPLVLDRLSLMLRCCPQLRPNGFALQHLRFGISSNLLSGGFGPAIPTTLDLLIKPALFRDFAIALPLLYSGCSFYHRRRVHFWLDHR